MRSVKALDDGSLLILAAPFSGPFRGLDADGERFTPATNFCLDWEPKGRPLLYDHGLDPDVGLEPIGTVDLASARKDAAGLWVRAQLSKSSKYWLAIRQLLAQAEEALFASSGAYSHLTKRSPQGEILVWPIVEISLTTQPSNFFARVTPAQAKAWKSAGLVLPAPPAVLLGDPDPRAAERAVLRSAAVAVIEAQERLKQGRV